MTIQPGNPKSYVNIALERALQLPRGVVLAHIAQTRRAHPGATPKEVCRLLERRYLAAVSCSGAASGAAAALPGVSTPLSLALAGGDAVGFISASALLALSLAEIHGVHLDDVERRRTLIMAVLLGDSGAATVTRIAERTGSHWGKRIAGAVPIETIRRINGVLGRNFVTRYGTRQGILVLGKAAPFGVGAVIGASGNFACGRMAVTASRRAFGDPPADWSGLTGRKSPTPDAGSSNSASARFTVVA